MLQICCQFPSYIIWLCILHCIITKYNIQAHMSFHMGPTTPRETTSTYYKMLHWGLLPRLTTDIVTQGLDTIYTFRKVVTHIPNGVQQHTMIIYIRISFEVTNTSTPSRDI